jgi:repressor LexA
MMKPNLAHAPSPALRPLAIARRLPPPLGRIAAGFPLEAIEDRHRDELLELLTEPGRYALRVGDDSMLEAGIFAGDFVVIQSQQTVRDGDIVVALVDNEQLSLNRFRRIGDGRIRLYADNPACDDRVLEQARVRIQGKVVGQVRRYR